ncbi:hypothetical protein [Dokdonella soli]|uniref:YceI family protein n=1 Tax=Dokdonella soli TaxID=529810 RepID=A0ABP3TRC5_9GAMM
MSISKFARSIALICSLSPLTAIAASSGSCNYHGTKIAVIDGIAYHKPVFDKLQPAIALASVKLDTAKIAASGDSDKALREQVSNLQDGLVQLSLSDRGVDDIRGYFPDAHSVQDNALMYPDKRIGELKLARSDAKGIAGSFTLKASKPDDLSCDLKFDLSYSGFHTKD